MASRVESLAKELTLAIEDVDSGALSESTRIAALEATTKLTTALQKPEDALFRMAYQPTIFMAARVGIDIGLFEALSDKRAVTAKELADATESEELLVDRILRVLASSGYVKEVGPSTYGSTALSDKLQERKIVAMVKFIFDLGLPSATKLPEWLRMRGFKSPTEPDDGPWQYAFDTKLGIFPWLVEHPDQLDVANTFFEGDRGSRPSWLEWFPIQEKLLHRSKADINAPLIVDVAGGRGHDIEAFKKRFPEQPGRFVLEDTPFVIDDISSLDPSIERLTFDFFKDSPVKGSRIYYMKFIMHDWSDEHCRIILRNVMTAMEKGYSKLVIEDFIIPDEKCSLLPAMWDLEMLLYLSGLERTRRQWSDLLGSVGLKIEDFYPPPGDGQGIIIAEVAE